MPKGTTGIMLYLNLILTSIISVLLPLFLFMILNRTGSFGKDGNVISMEKHYVLWIIFAAFLFRVILAVRNPGHSFDMSCFQGWSRHLYEDGFGNFYSGDFFSDYPPGYLYVLYIIGWIRHSWGLSEVDGISLFLIKLPAVLCDILAGYLIYKNAKKSGCTCGTSAAVFFAALYLFMPGVYINSAVWGQVDAVYLLMVLLFFWGIMEKKLPISYAAFGVGMLIKPQMLFFGIILVLVIADQVFLENFSLKRFFIHLGSGLGAIGGMFLLSLPFGLDKVCSQYVDTLHSYPYASVNAYNFWTMLGLNWTSQDSRAFGLPISVWGTIFIVLICVITFLLWLFNKKRDISFYYCLAATYMLLLFTFSTHMHERYLFPAMALFLLAFVHSRKKMDFYLFLFVSVIHYINVYHVLYLYDVNNFSRRAPFPVFTGLMLTALGIFSVVYMFNREKAELCRESSGIQTEKEKTGIENGKKTEEKDTEEGEKTAEPNGTEEGEETAEKEYMEKKPENKTGFKKCEWIFISVLTLIYTVIAFYDLGDLKAPQTFYVKEREDERENTITLDFGKNTKISAVSWYLGYYEERNFELETSGDGEHFYVVDEMVMDSVFRWDKHETWLEGRYIRLTGTDGRFSIGELVFLDPEGNRVLAVNSRDYPELFDEQDLYPSEFTYRNGTYFDEIYHARTAYEYLNGLYSYENTHPPLGKIIISLGIRLFGMCPFGWRFMGTFFGVLMVPLFYLFARRLLGDSLIIPMGATLFFTFDFMHFTQTRIATIDVFVTFFIMGAYYFMYKYVSLDLNNVEFKKSMVPLGLSGLFMSLAIASKWTGIYAGVGLALIFFGALYFQRVKVPVIVRTLTLCLVFFILVPAVVYTLSYIPFRDNKGWGLIPSMINNQKTMFDYHSTLEAEHYYASKWYSWPIILKPILYYRRLRENGLSEGISAMGNPVVWWMGILALFYIFYAAIFKRDKKALFLLVSYASQFVPWVFISRLTFIYHYFPSVPFVVLMSAYGAKQMDNRDRRIRWLWLACAVMAVGLFILFYPVISGMPVTHEYVDRFLRWFDSWVLLL